MKRLLLFAFVCIIVSGIVLAAGVYTKSDERIDDTDPELYISLGNFLMKNSLEGYALAAYNKALELNPEDPKALNNLGVCYIDSDPEIAEEYFLLSLEKDTGYELARKNLALLYNGESRYEDAIAQLRILADAYPGNIQYNYDLGINLAMKFRTDPESMDELDEAIAYLEKAEKINPDFMKVKENIKVLKEIRALVSDG